MGSSSTTERRYPPDSGTVSQHLSHHRSVMLQVGISSTATMRFPFTPALLHPHLHTFTYTHIQIQNLRNLLEQGSVGEAIHLLQENIRDQSLTVQAHLLRPLYRQQVCGAWWMICVAVAVAAGPSFITSPLICQWMDNQWMDRSCMDMVAHRTPPTRSNRSGHGVLSQPHPGSSRAILGQNHRQCHH